MPFAQFCHIEESRKSFKSWPYFITHVTRIEKNTPKRKRYVSPFQWITNIHVLNATYGFYEKLCVIPLLRVNSNSIRTDYEEGLVVSDSLEK